MNAHDLLDELNRTDEHARLEAKAARDLGVSTLETVCAFANEPGLGGGTLLLGVERGPNGVYHAVGIADPDRASQELASACATRFSTPIRPRIEVAIVENKVLLVVSVDEVPASEKPVYFVKQGLPKGAYRRVGSTDQRLVDEDLAALFDRQQGLTFDRGPVRDARRDDIDPAAIAEYRRLRAELAPNAAELGWADDDLLEALGGLVREGDRLVPTVAGIIVFGRPMALRRLFPMVRMDYVRVYGTEWAPGPDGRFDARELRGPAILIVRELVNIVVEGLLKRIVVDEHHIQRREFPQLPADVIREAVVNALMHRSYRRQDPLMIIRYSNRLEITNVGTSLKHEDAFGTTGSVPRNPTIASIFHETGLAETKGSGIRTMREKMKAAGLALPTLISNRRDDQFNATFLFHHFLDRADVEWLARFGELGLSTVEMVSLVFVNEMGAIDNLALRQMAGVDAGVATMSLRKLRQVGLLEAFGRGPATYYRPTSQLFSVLPVSHDEGGFKEGRIAPLGDSNSPDFGVIPHDPSPLSQEFLAIPHDPSPLSQEFRPLSHNPSAMSQDLADTPTTMPPDLQDIIAAVGRRAGPTVVQDALVRICAHGAFGADQLAAWLGRNPAYVVRTYLTPLVEAGRLERTYPQMLNHPDQAYRTP